MCGIVGFVSDTPDENLILNMISSIKHRGPDDFGYKIIEFGNKFLHLGSARLSITGLNDGSMPMYEKQNCLIYNGEIYELNLISSFIKENLNSSSDTRHLFKFLEKGGISHLSLLNGMFAFAYFNKSVEKLYLSRDKFGIKPLYYSSSKKFDIIFSSELKTFLDNNISEKKISTSNLIQYLAFGGLTPEGNLIEGIKALKPGEVMEINPSGKISNLNFTKKIPPRDKYDNSKFYDILVKSVEDQLKADIPVDLLLSGGIDSSLLSAIIYKELNRSVNSYTLSFDSENFDESKNASSSAKKLGINLEIINYPSNLNNEIIFDLMSKLPEPIADPSIIPTYYLANKVSEKTKSVITGDGADEIFGGYDWYRASKIKKLIPNKSFINFLILISKQLKVKNNISLADKLTQFAEGYDKEFLVDVLFWQNSNKLFNDDFLIEIYKQFISKLNLKNELEDLKTLDQYNYLYSNILKKSDTASMLNGLEIRPVFLDNRILDYANNLDITKNVGYIYTKKNLRKLLRAHMPINSLHFKRGFSHDFGDWTENEGYNYIMNFKNDFEFIKNYEILMNSSSNSYIKSRYTWNIYSILKWSEINKISII